MICFCHPFYLISCILVFLTASDLTTAILASYYVVSGLGGEDFQAIWMITGYLLGSGLGVIFSSWLNNTFYLKRSIFISIFGYCFFNLVCFLCEDYGSIVIFRALIGFFSAIVFVTVNDISICLFPDDIRQKLNHVWACLITIGLFFGINFGALVAELFTYKAIFIVKSAIFMLLIVACEFSLESDIKIFKKRTFNAISFCALSIFLIGVQLILDLGYQSSWLENPFLLSVCILSLCSFALLCMNEHLTLNKLFNYKVLLKKEFLEVSIIIGFSFGMGIAALTGFASWLLSCYNYTVLWISLALSFSGILPVICSIFMQRLINYFGARALAIFCYCSLCICLIAMTQFNNYLEFWMVALLRFAIGIFFAFWLPSLSAIVSQFFKKEQMGAVLTNITVLRFILSSFVLSILSNIEIYRKIFHQSNLIQALSRYPQVKMRYMKEVAVFLKKKVPSLNYINDAVDIQATTLAAIDVWFITALIVAFILLALIFLLKEQKIQNKMK